MEAIFPFPILWRGLLVYKKERMSRGFVKEGDQEELPVIPPRAALPNGVNNYVTAKGMELLLAEKKSLEKERARIPKDNESQHRRDTTIINGKINLLQGRINSAEIIMPSSQPRDEVRFGCRVTYKMFSTKKEATFQIVGVDEADIKNKKIAFVAPIAKALTGHKVGDNIEFKLGKETRKIEVLAIN